MGLLLVANIVNIGADLAAMGAAARPVLGGDQTLCMFGFAAVSLLLQLFVPYHRYVRLLRVVDHGPVRLCGSGLARSGSTGRRSW
ncbi:hypothetical protein ACRAWD_17730 [Caulobacter segnis]